MSQSASNRITTSVFAGLLAAACGSSSPSPESPDTPETTTTDELAPPEMEGAEAGDPNRGGHEHADEAADAKDCCKGLNECKGQGGCGVDGRQSCHGQNECKGKGGCNAHCPQ